MSDLNDDLNAAAVWADMKAQPWLSLLVLVAVAMIPTGIYLAFSTDNPEWLLLCIPLFFFLS